MQTELAAIETVTDLSPALSLLQDRKGRKRVNHKYARKSMQSKERCLLKIAMLILAADITVSISSRSLTATKYITIKRLQCVKVGKSQTHKLQCFSQSMTQASKNQPPACKTILLTKS